VSAADEPKYSRGPSFVAEASDDHSGRVAGHVARLVQLTPGPGGDQTKRSALLSLPRLIAAIVLVAAVYFASARLGLSLAFSTKQVTAIWPPTGVALAALVLMGYRVWPGIYVGAFFANTLANEPATVAMCIAASNTLTGMIGARTLRALRFDPALLRSRDVVSLILIAITSTLISATLGTGVLTHSALISWSSYSSVWWTWWVGDSLGILLGAPFLFTWITDPRLRLRGTRALEFIAYLSAALLIGILVFTVRWGEHDPFYPRSYLAFPLLVWAGLRFGQRETVLGAVLISICAVWGAIHGWGPFGSGPPDARLIFLDTFIGTIGCTALLMGAVVAERQGARMQLRKAHDELERRVAERTAELSQQSMELAQRNKENETLLREIHHRVKNNLQVICSLLSLQAQAQGEPQSIAFADECKSRVRSMALVHEHLYHSKDLHSVPLASYIRTLVEGLQQTHAASGHVTCSVEAMDVTLPIDQAVPCGLIVNELVTNSLKHGFPHNRAGNIQVSAIRNTDNRIDLIVRDDGVGMPADVEFSRAAGFGLRLVTMLADQLYAVLDVRRNGGTEVRITLPCNS
jgi:two-component sensor histidine kinase/integral membrane sensor domain MASE1